MQTEGTIQTCLPFSNYDSFQQLFASLTTRPFFLLFITTKSNPSLIFVVLRKCFAASLSEHAMRFFSQYLLTTSAILSQTVFSLPSPSLQQEATGYDYGNGDVPEKLHERQSPGPYITTGVKTNPAGSPLPLRMEMREMQKNTILWNLYLLGLDYVQRNKSQSHIESWYQLSGMSVWFQYINSKLIRSRYTWKTFHTIR